MIGQPLPHAERGHVEERKIKDYLLSATHPRGRTKAAFFRARGFSEADWEGLADALRHHAKSHPVAAERPTAYAVNYALECHVPTPDGTNPCIRTVWEIRIGEARPRLITAYPLI